MMWNVEHVSMEKPYINPKIKTSIKTNLQANILHQVSQLWSNARPKFFFFFYYQRPLIVTGYYITVKLEHAMPPYIRRPHKVSNPRTAVYFWQPWDALESCNQVFGFWYQHVSLIPIIDTDKMHCNHNKTVLFVQLECI